MGADRASVGCRALVDVDENVHRIEFEAVRCITRVLV